VQKCGISSSFRINKCILLSDPGYVTGSAPSYLIVFVIYGKLNYFYNNTFEAMIL